MNKVREFTYQKLTPEEQKSRGILGRLAGVIADFKRPTRNGRLYTEELWDKVFDSDIMKEKIETKTVLGELGHPANREEIDMEKVAISLAEEPQKCPDGTIKGVFDILDTPNGRILKTLCDYGCKVGVSSRGTGDIVEDWGGNQSVDPDTYNCECWDAVLLPSVKSARPSYVNESLNINSNLLKLKEALKESLEKATPEDRRIMEATIATLNLDNKPEMVEDKGIVDSKSKSSAANNIGADVVKNLQDLLKNNKSLQEQLRTLQEKLSVCNAKEVESEEKVQNYQREIESLNEQVKILNGKVKSINSKLVESTKLIESKQKDIDNLLKKCDLQESRVKSLNESYSKKSNIEAKRLKEAFEVEKSNLRKNIQKLEESLEDRKQDSIIKSKEYNEKIAKANSLIEHYKKIANTSINKYIALKAKLVGVPSEDIKRRLNESYSFKDIDRICNQLNNIQVDIGTLPFNGKKPKMEIKESVEPILPKSRFNDEVDEDLLSLANRH